MDEEKLKLVHTNLYNQNTMRIVIIFWSISAIVYGFHIENLQEPVCAKCKYFEPYGSFNNKIAIELGKCKYFGKKNILDGTIEYEYASCARKYMGCGIKGVYYKHDPKYMWKYKKTYIKPILTVSPFIILILIYYLI